MTATANEICSEIDKRMFAFRAQQTAANDVGAYFVAVGAHIALREQTAAILQAVNTPTPLIMEKIGSTSSLWQTILAALSGLIPTLPANLQSLLSILLILLPSI